MANQIGEALKNMVNQRKAMGGMAMQQPYPPGMMQQQMAMGQPGMMG